MTARNVVFPGIGAALLVLLVMASFSAWASVTMTGTRVIYRSDARSVDVQLANRGNVPYIVQTWFDEGDMNDGPESKRNIPFVVSPASFRIAPNAGQVARISYTRSRALPEDRESIFYFNFQQIPPSNVGGDAAAGQNKMLVVLRNRVKLFFRPSQLGNPPANVLSTVKVTATREGQRSGVVVSNTLPFYLNVSKIALNASGAAIPATADMVAPLSQRTFWFTRTVPSGRHTVTLTIISDQGARLSADFPL